MKRRVSILLLMTVCVASVHAQTSIPVAAFQDSIRKQHVQVLDVRTASEYAGGYLPQSLQADWNNPEEFQKRVVALDKNEPIYTYCLSGVRSKAAAEWLNQHGYHAYSLAGGVNAWKQSGLPLAQAAVVPQISMETYEVAIHAGPVVLVDFGAEWCPPCRKMKPVIDSFVQANSTRLSLYYVDGGAQDVLSSKLNVIALPTFILYKNGKEVWRKEGVFDVREIADRL